jgi:hypothetical protein
MQRREFDRATFEVANNRDMSGRATADEIDRGLRTGKGRSLWRIACSTFLWSLTAVGFVLALGPMPAWAAAGGVPAEISALQSQVSELQSIVHTLQDQVSALQTSNSSLQTQLAAVQSNHALLLGPFVSVDPNPEIGVAGPNITFAGANIHIVSGSGSTYDNSNSTGLGNLIIGYDEDPSLAFGNPLEPGDRSGSHNLVIGPLHRFTQASLGGFVAGQANLIANVGASVTGGEVNTASGFLASVTGGVGNTASGDLASVTGGGSNTASGLFASVLGGGTNIASGGGASVTGGAFNTASGPNTVVLGGQNVTDNKDSSIAPQPPFP